MWIETTTSYSPENEIQSIIDENNKPKIEEESTTRACIEEENTGEYLWEWDFEPILRPTFDENGKQTWFEVPEDEDPDNLCPTLEEINKMYD